MRSDAVDQATKVLVHRTQERTRMFALRIAVFEPWSIVGIGSFPIFVVHVLRSYPRHHRAMFQ